jgi:hypothetical protein
VKDVEEEMDKFFLPGSMIVPSMKLWKFHKRKTRSL